MRERNSSVGGCNIMDDNQPNGLSSTEKQNEIEVGSSIDQKDSYTSRRDFLRHLSLGTAALATGINIRALEALGENKGRKLGVALLGLGRYSTNELGPALRQTKLCYLAALVTGHPEKAENGRQPTT